MGQVGVAQGGLRQSEDSIFLRRLADEVLVNGKAYENLRVLTKTVGGRLSGSPQYYRAEAWGQKALQEAGAEKVWLQECAVPHWIRGGKDSASWVATGGSAGSGSTGSSGSAKSGSGSGSTGSGGSGSGSTVDGGSTGVSGVATGRSAGGSSGGRRIGLDILALGNSLGTGPKGIEAPVILIHSFEELEQRKNEIKGNIVFYNYTFNPRFVETFRSYSDAVRYRVFGASQAAKYGAVGVLVRSMSHSVDNNPHTGAMFYNDSFPKIPAAAIGLWDADKLAAALEQKDGGQASDGGQAPDGGQASGGGQASNGGQASDGRSASGSGRASGGDAKKGRGVIKVYLRTQGQMLPDTVGHNVIGEIRGSEFPNEFITVGGHLDSWDPAEGAQDDGAGCVHSIEVLRALKASGYKPRHSIRVVLFANEENGGRGGEKYADEAKEKGEKHLFALESDAGGFTPRAFSISLSEEKLAAIRPWLSLLQPYGVYSFDKGGGGADVNPLEPKLGAVVGELRPDSQRYFDYHHSRGDVLAIVNKRELELGALNMAALVYLVDKYGF